MDERELDGPGLLQRDYPALASELVHAIWSDFAERPRAEALQESRKVLDSFYAEAVAEQATDFDPSGSSGDVGQESSAGTRSGGSDEASSPGETASQVTDDTLESGCFRESEYLDAPSKEALLAETFPNLRFELVARVLANCGNNLSRATDELLNHVAFADPDARPIEEWVPKGIDAFSEDHHVPQRSKRGKGKKKGKGKEVALNARRTAASGSVVGSPPANHWQSTNRNIEFVASRVKIPRAAVSSLFHRNGASLATTIMALIEKDLEDNKSDKEPDAELVEPALDLIGEFNALDLQHAVALVRLTAPSTTYAHELADALLKQPDAVKSRGGVDIVVRHAPLRLSEPDPAPFAKPALPPSALPYTSASLSAARGAAFDQASAAFRKGRSDPLMKAAAGYYSQIGRDLTANLKVMTEADADALVASQSTSAYLDLHGVSVQSATRIARAKTQAWWDGLGEARIPGGGRAGVGQGYRIITGLGRHSEGGRAKIGPAVSRALINEGWKIEIGTGELVVMGKAVRR